MSAKTLLANESVLGAMEERIAELRTIGSLLVKRGQDTKFSFADGIEQVAVYDDSLQILRELGERLFDALDLVDPEDNELQRREDEEEEEEEEGDDAN